MFENFKFESITEIQSELDPPTKAYYFVSEEVQKDKSLYEELTNQFIQDENLVGYCLQIEVNNKENIIDSTISLMKEENGEIIDVEHIYFDETEYHYDLIDLIRKVENSNE